MALKTKPGCVCAAASAEIVNYETLVCVRVCVRVCLYLRAAAWYVST